ncbi:VUT family protein [Litorimonas haliclonae]|uniref:VUT family protein n=1 Tax=Litorimonas haliclonae TaxID=2081977 RepID=UPI0039F147D4
MTKEKKIAAASTMQETACEESESRKPTTSLFSVKYTLLYVLLIPFINWSFTWAPMVNLPGLAAWAFNPVTIVTGLVLVVRDFSQREIGHEVLFAMALALGLTYVTSGGALALASGAAFLISELVDYAMFTFTKYKLSTRVLLSSAIAAPIDTTAFLYGASFIRVDQLTAPNIIMSVGGKMVGAIIIWWLIRQRMERGQTTERV